MFRKLIVISALFLTANQVAAEVTAWVDQNPVVSGTMFRLHVEAKNVDDAEEADLSIIPGIQVLNRSVQNKTSIVGTAITRSVHWTYILLAQSAGEYLIPALLVGNEKTSEILLKVVDGIQKKQQELIRLEVSATPIKVYPQQQVVVLLKIIRTGAQLENESITPFELDGAQVRKLEQRSYKAVQNGKRMIITEISYAVLPEKSGTLNLPQIRYQGDLLQESSSKRVFGNFGDIFRQRAQRIYSTSPELSIEVRPLPAGFKDWWLPAEKLEIVENWQPDPPVFQVGEPVTRTVEILATGVFGNQIPQLSFNFPESLKAYADQPVIETQHTSEGLSGIRKEKWAIIPTKAGKTILPGSTVSWWNVKKDEYQTVIIPAKTIEVLPAVGSALKNTEEEVVPQIKQITSTTLAPVVSTKQEYMSWKILTLIFAALWCGTILLWYYRTKKGGESKLDNTDNSKHNQRISIKRATNNVANALTVGDPVKVQSALLSWGNIVWPNNPPHGLEQIGDRVPEIKNSINALNSVLYGKLCKESSFEELKKEFSRLSFAEYSNNKNSKYELGELYPETK